MKRLLISIIITACTLGAFAQLKKYTLELGEFRELTVVDNINVNYKYLPDSAGKAVYICEAKVAPVITFINNKGKLKVEITSDQPVEGKIPTIMLYSDDLSKVTNLGDSTINVLSLKPCEAFNAKVIGNGTINVDGVHATKLSAAVEAGHGAVNVNGKVQESKYTIASVGTVNAENVASSKTKCLMMGTGVIICQAAETLTVYGAGSGSVSYIGDPSIKKRALGVKLQKVNK